MIYESEMNAPDNFCFFLLFYLVQDSHLGHVDMLSVFT